MPLGSSLSRIVLLTLGVTALAAGPNAGAQSERGSLTVVVRSAETQQPLAGALVSVVGSVSPLTTDEAGIVRLERVRPGEHRIEVRAVGYLPVRASVSLPDGATELTVELEPAPVQLEEVEVQGMNESPLQHNGFYARKQSGQGTFITREAIERARPRALSDLFRNVPGVSVSHSSSRGTARTSMRGNTGEFCPPQVFVDGAQAPYYNIDNIPPHTVEGIEIYRGSASIPAEYNRGMSACGVVLVWTKVN